LNAAVYLTRVFFFIVAPSSGASRLVTTLAAGPKNGVHFCQVFTPNKGATTDPAVVCTRSKSSFATLKTNFFAMVGSCVPTVSRLRSAPVPQAPRARRVQSTPRKGRMLAARILAARILAARIRFTLINCSASGEVRVPASRSSRLACRCRPSARSAFSLAANDTRAKRDLRIEELVGNCIAHRSMTPYAHETHKSCAR